MIGPDIILDLQNFIQQQSFPPSKWSVGIAADAERALFQDHYIDRDLGSWIYRMADSLEVARLVHETCLQWGCAPAECSPDRKGIYVYAYLKSGITTSSAS
jgi:hypothetical protein